MNREIKFRVWDSDLKKMRYLNSTHDIIEFDEKGIGEYHNLQTGYGEWFSELMQSTGLKDKNGIEIYEGDIVSSPFRNIINRVETYIISYYKFGFMLQEYDLETKQYGDYECFIGDLLGKLEVIGNIYDKGE